MLPNLTPKDIERFWSKVDRSGGPDACYPWLACKDKNGYGCFGVRNRQYHAHRIARKIATGEDPGPLHTLHSCDNPPCCNPNHLFLGTISDNSKDMYRKGRQWIGIRGGRWQARGGDNGHAKLTDDQVVEIKSRLVGAKRGIGKQLAAEYGVSVSTISLIKLGRIWTHVAPT